MCSAVHKGRIHGIRRMRQYTPLIIRILALSTLLPSLPVVGGEWIEGPDGVQNQIEREDTRRVESAEAAMMKAYSRWKETIRSDYGLSFGIQYLALHQRHTVSTRTDAGEKGAGGIFRINGSYEIFETNDGDAGWLEWRVENRHSLFGLISPSEAGNIAGIVAQNPADGYLGSFNTDLAVASWTQLFSGRWGYSIGRLAYASYLDAGYFQTFSGGFLNSAFIASPAVASTGVGALGFAVKGFLSPHFIAGVQAHDANAQSGRFSLDTVRQNEYLSAVELAWTRYPYQTDKSKVLVTAWHKDARKNTGDEAGYGLAINTTLKKGNIIPFLHLAFNNGGGGVAAQRAASAGMEYQSNGRGIWVLGVGWADPVPSAGARDEYVAETSYRFDVFAGFELMLDLQYVRPGSASYSQQGDWIGSLRIHMNL